MLRLRLSLVSLIIGLLILAAPPTSWAQSVESVVEDMQAVQQEQFETVDTYIVETNRYTSYNKKIIKGESPAYKTEIRMSDGSESNLGEMGSPSSSSSLNLSRLKKHATYEGSETVNGAECHVLNVENVSDVHPNAGQSARRATYHIDADRHLPVRMVMEMTGQQGSKDQVVTVNMKNYQSTDGLTLPHRTEIDFNLDMSEKQRQQMKQMMEKMKNLPEEQRKRMQQAMGGEQMNMMKQMMSNEPIVVKVQNVTVNADLPDDVF